MYVQDIAAGEYTRHACLETLIDDGTLGDGAEFYACRRAELVLGDETAGQQQHIALYPLLGALDGLEIGTDLCDRYRRDMLFALDIDHGMRQHERYAEVVETLDDVPFQTAGIRHELRDQLHLSALEGHAASHDEPDISRAEDDDLLARHIALDVHEPLRRACREDACRTVAGDVKRSAGLLTAAHSEDDSLRLYPEHAVLAVHRGDGAVGGDVHDHGVELVLYAPFKSLTDEAVGVLGACQLLLEGVQTEAVVNALVEYAAELLVALEDDHAARSAVVCGYSRRESRGTSADYHYIIA